MKRKLRNQRVYEEVQDELQNVEQTNEMTIATIGSTDFILPSEMADALKPLVGREIDILRTEWDYRLRVISSTTVGLKKFGESPETPSSSIDPIETEIQVFDCCQSRKLPRMLGIHETTVAAQGQEAA